MKYSFQLNVLLLFVLTIFISFFGSSQQVPIINYSMNPTGQVELEVNSTEDNYYILKIKHHPDSAFTITSSMTFGEAGSTIITEPLEHYPLEHYQVLEYAIDTPFDTDGDGLDDVAEYNYMPTHGPLNFAESIDTYFGRVVLNTLSAFNEVSIQEDIVPWIPYLNGKEYVKFIILDFYSTQPRIYFINTNNFDLHAQFADTLGVPHLAPSVVKGQVIFHPNVLSPNGTLGTYAYNYSNNDSKDFEVVQRSQELLAANMPYLTNNLVYFVTEDNEADYFLDETLYQNSRVPVLFESDVFAGIDYWGLHQTEGYGFFREMSLNEVPGPKDIVLYNSIPNSLPRVGGIITSVIQTPLSHVNLRAIQDNVPNAFIRDPLTIDTIADLLDHYIYFNVEQSDYIIREATLEEVNAWYEKSRPAVVQNPPLNLDYTDILPLDNITFDMHDGFGAKVANVSAMRRFGFPDGTVPDGFGIPFHYYREFMEYNNFFDEIAIIMQQPDFIADRDIRDVKLEEFREKIENASMPAWIMNDLANMHKSFPVGTSVRCRSSTNNEDLPGFSGAGLYESKTQHPDEGHISKSIKQVYASLWNLRAFEERDFYRINHFYTSMGVLCHPNFSGELVNGVGVSADPVYSTENTFYLNSQLGSELITNPGSESIPEELLLNRNPVTQDDYSVIQYSSLLPDDSLLMTQDQLNTLRYYLAVINDEFAKLYNAEHNTSFAMDIEYKVALNGQLIVKQARPWVEYTYQEGVSHAVDDCVLLLFPNPSSDFVNVTCQRCELSSIRITDYRGKLIREKLVNDSGSSNAHIDVEDLPAGFYIISGFKGNTKCSSAKFLKR